MEILWIWALIAAGLCQTVSTESIEWTIPIEHNIKGDDTSWVKRGHIVLFSSRIDGGLIGRYHADGFALGDAEKQQLVDAIASHTLYKIRAPSRLDQPTIELTNPDTFAMSYTEPNRLIQGDLQEVMMLQLDMAARRLVSISTQPIVLNYDASYIPIVGDLMADAFNTTVRCIDAQDGPTPDTVAYIQKLEHERQAREQGEAPDNRSFLAKYWMYIVPVVIFLMVSSAANPEGEAGR